MIRSACVAIVCVAACQTPDLKLVYTFAEGSFGQDCGTTDCAQLPMECDSVLHVRILTPSDPNVPHISVCEEIRPDANRDVCAIGRVDIDRVVLPRQVLEVQVTIWPKDAVTDPVTGKLDCRRIPVEFDAAMGFPISGPAFGGRTFYHPGDEETVVTLGCTNIDSINSPTCSGVNNIEVDTTVFDFESLPALVSQDLGDKLTVSVGEPKVDGTAHVLNSADAIPLSRTVSGPTPVWGGGANLVLQSSVCIQVLEDGAQTTASLRCNRANTMTKTVTFAGMRLSKATLDQILTALALADFPEEGLTVGIVLDEIGNPIAGANVGTSGGTVQYLNASRTAVGGSVTSSNGIFVSRDAPYNTTFSSFVATESASTLGGLVRGKVTIALLQFGSVGT